ARLQFIFFVIGPFIAAIIIVFSDKELISARKRLIFNLALSIGIAILVAGFWYLPKLFFLLKTYSYYGFSSNFPPEFSPKLFSPASLTFYFRGLVNGQITPFFFLFFLIGFLELLKRKKLNPILLSWIIVSFIILTLVKSKEFRMTSEYLPAFALITAGGILLLQKRWLKRCLVFIIILGGLLQYLLVSFTNPSSTRIRLSFFNGKSAKGRIASSYLYPLSEAYLHYPGRGDWQINKVMSAIQKEGAANNKNMIIGCTDAYLDVKTDWFDPFNLGTWHDNFVAANSDALNYFVRANGLSYNVVSLSYWQEDWRNIPMLDFIVSVKEIENIAPALSRQYKLILQAEAPDKSPIYVYKKIPPSIKI
ncbi:MAG: hypothetical protein PHW54_01885, partial [Candidatus Omnitrophica bacterium]|nr:hypothetical protein [Candidatus Omnitrophota bacterium]